MRTRRRSRWSPPDPLLDLADGHPGPAPDNFDFANGILAGAFASDQVPAAEAAALVDAVQPEAAEAEPVEAEPAHHQPLSIFPTTVRPPLRRRRHSTSLTTAASRRVQPTISPRNSRSSSR